MKKISKLTLRKLDVSPSDILRKKELKHILGGYNGSYYCDQCQCSSGGGWFMACGTDDDIWEILKIKCGGNATCQLYN